MLMSFSEDSTYSIIRSPGGHSGLFGGRILASSFSRDLKMLLNRTCWVWESTRLPVLVWQRNGRLWNAEPLPRTKIYGIVRTVSQSARRSSNGMIVSLDLLRTKYYGQHHRACFDFGAAVKLVCGCEKTIAACLWRECCTGSDLVAGFWKLFLEYLFYNSNLWYCARWRQSIDKARCCLRRYDWLLKVSYLIEVDDLEVCISNFCLL